MTYRTKQAVVCGALALFTIWPVVHIGLVKKYDLSPWKLAGWGMYSVPRDNYRGMEIYGRRPGSDEPIRLTAPNPEIQQAAGAFLERYRWLRRLAAPDDLVAAVRAAHPDWEAVRVVVFRTDLDLDSSMIVMREHAYDYGE